MLKTIFIATVFAITEGYKFSVEEKETVAVEGVKFDRTGGRGCMIEGTIGLDGEPCCPGLKTDQNGICRQDTHAATNLGATSPHLAGNSKIPAHIYLNQNKPTAAPTADLEELSRRTGIQMCGKTGEMRQYQLQCCSNRGQQINQQQLVRCM